MRVRMVEEHQPVISEENTPPTPTYSQSPTTHAPPPPPTPAGVPIAYSGAPSMHLPLPTSPGMLLTYSGAPLHQPPSSTAQASSSNTGEHMCIAALEGAFSQMVADMTDFMSIFKGQNHASSNVTPPPGHRPMVDPNSWVPPTFALESEDAPAPATTQVLVVHPVTDLLSLPPALTTIPLPPVTFLMSDTTVRTLPPLDMPVPLPVYIVLLPTVFPDSRNPRFCSYH
ncbi:hypothetical protein CDL15_Pgr003917 [Punica granatum]|uniref:Extensin-like n=1 Tax=Punica granatum TaxID=22663 RepID=A0A218X4P6_PUNGR|nr:hypothetical protein CDL15_Pgr003917 [Punica granatum]